MVSFNCEKENIIREVHIVLFFFNVTKSSNMCTKIDTGAQSARAQSRRHAVVCEAPGLAAGQSVMFPRPVMNAEGPWRLGGTSGAAAGASE